MKIGRLIAGTEFIHSKKHYVILKSVLGRVSRFKIFEKADDFTVDKPSYAECPDRIYAFCFDTCSIGSFAPDTGVEPMVVQENKPPPVPQCPPAPPKAPKPLTDAGQDEPAPDQEKQMKLVLDLFHNVVAKQTYIDEKIAEIDDLAEQRDQAEDRFNASRNALWKEIEKLVKVPVGYYVVNGYVVRIMTNSLALFKVENA